MDGLLAAASLDVDPCGDVYRGLARLFGSRSDTPRVVVVCVDGLGPAELEFFSLLSRARRDVAAYVYGDERVEPRIAKAIELGARGRATEAVIRSIASHEPARVTAPGDTDASTRLETSDTAWVPRSPIEQRPTRQSAAPAAGDLDDESEEVAREPVEGAVRVPWLRYDDKPARAAPAPPAPSARHGADVKREPPPIPQTHEPLLTEAELQALIGDDIAAIAPDDPGAGSGHEHDGGVEDS